MKDLNKYTSAYSTEKLYYFDEEIFLSWYAKRLIEKFKSDVSVLDLGLGHGITADVLSRHFTDYTVLEGSSEIIDGFRKKYQNSSLNIVNTFFEDFSIKKRYDLIIMGFILEHVNDPIQIMKQYKDFLAVNNTNNNVGTMILAVPNAEAMNRRLGKYANLLNDLTELSEYDKELGHLRYYTMETFTKDIETSGLKIKNMEGLYLKPFTTKQIISLNFEKNILDALCLLGVKYPELSVGIMAECQIA